MNRFDVTWTNQISCDVTMILVDTTVIGQSVNLRHRDVTFILSKSRAAKRMESKLSIDSVDTLSFQRVSFAIVFQDGGQTF